MRCGRAACVLVLYLLACVSSSSPSSHALSLVRQWLESLKDFEAYKANVAENAESYGELTAPFHSHFSPADVSHDQAQFEGQLDEHGLADGPGLLYFPEPSDTEQCGQVQYFCIESNFTEGVPRGTTRGQRWDGGWAVEYFHLVGEGVPHGLHVEVSGPAQDYIVVEMMLNGSPSADKGSWLRRHSVISFAKPSSSPETLWMHADLAKCEPVVFDTSLSVIRRVGNVSAWIEDGYCQVKWTTGQGELDDSIQIPQHLGKLTPREKQEVLAHLYATQCEKNFRTPYQNLVIDKELAMKESRDIAPHETFYPTVMKIAADRELTLGKKDPACVKVLRKVLFPLNGSVHRVGLVCFPGSGSKWLEMLLQDATGFGAMATFYPGQTAAGLMPHAGIMSKHHHCRRSYISLARRRKVPRPQEDIEERLWFLSQNQGRTILLLRNPFAVIISWWNHQFDKDREGAVEGVYGPKFEKFLLQEISNWRDLALDWITMGAEVLVVHYERLREDWERELRKLLKVLKFQADEGRMTCLRRNPLERFKRRGWDLPKSPYTAEHVGAINKVIDEVNGALMEAGLEELPLDLYTEFRNN